MEKERQVNGVEPEKSEDDIQREQLGPRVGRVDDRIRLERPGRLADPDDDRPVVVHLELLADKPLVVPVAFGRLVGEELGESILVDHDGIGPPEARIGIRVLEGGAGCRRDEVPRWSPRCGEVAGHSYSRREGVTDGAQHR